MHFDYEEGEFCRVEGYDCYGHYLKHYNFQTKFQSAHLPIPKEITDEAKNWLAQRIKMMPVPRLEEREKEVNSVLAGLTSISVEGSQLKISSASASLLLDPSQE